MKKILLFLFTISVATVSLANVQIQLKNIPHDSIVFIASLVDGRKIEANNVGGVSVIPDSYLESYPKNAAFTVGFAGNVTLRYCQNTSNSEQFVFKYNPNGDNIISLERKKQKLICEKV